MAGQSITFDFISRGAGKLAGDFKQTGDSAAAAARGAKILQGTIAELGQKENRTSEESARLAKALRLTGDEEDRAAAKALGAEIAIRKLAEEEERAAAKALKAEYALKKEAEAARKSARDALEAAAANRTLAGSLDKISKSSSLGPSFRGSLAALAPALIPLSGGIAAGVAAIGVSFGAAAIGAGLFSVAAKSVLSGASENLKKLQELELRANTARTAAQKKAAEQQIAALKSTWSAGYLDMLGALDGFQNKWTRVSQGLAVPVLTEWIRVLTKGLDLLKPAVQPVADVFRSWGQDVNRYLSSKAGSAEIHRMAAELGKFSASQLQAIGRFIVSIGKGAASLGRDLAAHGADFGAFGKHLDTWGAAFARWASSAAARRDVGALLDWVHANGKTTGDLLRSLGKFMAAFAPGLAAAGQLELQAVTGFLGFVARLPKSVARPLFDVAAALLLLSKTGVLKVGLKIVGPAVKWLTGGLIDLGGGTAAGAEIRAAMVSGGAAAAAEIRAAMTGGAAAGGVSTAGAGASGAAAGRIAGGGFLTAFKAAVTPVFAGVLGGLLIRAAGDTLSPAGTFAGKLNADFQADGHMWSTSLLHSFTFGGLEGWLTAKIGLPVGSFLNGMAASARAWGQSVSGHVTGAWAAMAGGAKTWWGSITGIVSGSLGRMAAGARGTTAGMASDFTHMSGIIAQAMQQSARAADSLRTRNLAPLLGEAGRVSGGIQGLAGYIGGTLSGAMNTGGQRADAFRVRNLGPLRGELARDSGGVQGLQAAINRMHGKTVSVIVQGGGKGKITIDSYGVGKVGTTGLKFMASGGAVTGGTPGRDSVLGMLMPGEVIVPAGMVKAGAVDHLRGRLPGFASGGLVGALGAAPGLAASTEAAFAGKVERAFAERALAALRAAAAGSGSGIVAYARQFLGQIPYVMGGNSLSGGIDCSGFVQQVYGHFGIHAPRTSETQYGWARKTGPVPGGLAFYVSPAGGPPPGHVAIVQDASSVISQGGGMGPKIERLRFLPLMGTGVPPAGFGAAAGKGGNPAVSGSLQAIALSLLKQYGWGNQWSAFNNLENAEAGWNMTARNPSSGAYGLAQFINGPGEYAQYGGDAVTGLGQLTAMMNYIGQRWHDPSGAWANEAAHHWYAKGGLVQKFDQGGTLRPGVTLAVNNTGHGEQVIPGYAAGGAVTTGGPAATAAYRARITALERREGADYVGLRRAFLHGPGKYLNRAVYTELLKMHRLQGAEQVAYGHLKGAGLTKANLDRLGAAARAEQRAALSAVLNRKHGGHPGWAAGLRYWLGQLSGAAGKGLPGGQLTSGPGGAGLPAITHTYGGDVTGTIGAFLSSVAAPFTGKVIADRGAWLKPGWNSPLFNATGRPEHLVPATSGGGAIRLEIASGGGSDFEQFMAAMIKKYVKVRGGGSVQRAYGSRLVE